MTIILLVASLYLPIVKSSGDELFQGREAYSKWTTENQGNYNRLSILSSSSDEQTAEVVVLRWSIIENQDDHRQDEIHLAIVVQATGWVGFGIGENGGMKGSDMFIFQASGGDLIDAYATALERPRVDQQQDWSLVRSIVADGLLIVEVTRLLDTGDSMDWPLTKDSQPFMPGTKIVAAWGDTEQMTYHGANQRLAAELRLFGAAHAVSQESLFKEEMDREAEGSIVMRANNILIPHKKTTFYLHHCYTASDLTRTQNLPANKTLHLIGIEWLIDREQVHHVILSQSTEDIISSCDMSNAPSSTLYVWSRANKFVLFPPGIGMVLTGNDAMAPKSFGLQNHYENPGKVKGVRDSTGARLYYTSKLRETTAGVIDLGDPKVMLRPKPVGNGLQSHRFSCPGTCTSNHLSSNAGVTVFNELLHMHTHGLSMHNIQKRDGKEVRRGSVEYYDFNQGGHSVKQEPFQVLPGDTFETVCNYNGTRRLHFGVEASDEMCIAYLLYYPATDIYVACSFQSGTANCSAQHTATQLVEAGQLERSFAVGDIETNLTKPTTAVKDSSRAGDSTILEVVFISIAITFCAVQIFSRCFRSSQKYNRVRTDPKDCDQEGISEARSCPIAVSSFNQTAVRRRNQPVSEPIA
eukprot:CAMPEP_0119009488 /NCGR_PEP_ID=MMETSP1176-20130426/4395_1 /TAXON_ID=265551 /ORGANISM="Synedropsis recta cf, Strain CCMP1620" /LENGTH=636 /DNA_ID=CAMNT_0006962011 /DNA_START=21 /DNA_END=1931 /DNA_ORIENTATION=-